MDAITKFEKQIQARLRVLSWFEKALKSKSYNEAPIINLYNEDNNEALEELERHQTINKVEIGWSYRDCLFARQETSGGCDEVLVKIGRIE